MEKVAINPNRLQWCMDVAEIDIDYLSLKIRVAPTTLEQAMRNKATLSVNQLEKIANYFKRSLLFFLDPSEIQEEKIYSPQFRTINNQKPIHSSKLRAFIERVEKHRQIYLDLLEELDEPTDKNWQTVHWHTNDIKQISASVRQLLKLPASYDFNTLRQAVENKGVMVIVSNGYNGKWQIDKKNPVRGFSLYYEILPIIVVKKQASKGAQAFTLMHELAHLLLHKESAIDHKDNFYSYQGKEKDANEFAGNLLIPDSFLCQINLDELLELEAKEYDHYLADFKKKWCVSAETILIRLLKSKKISQRHYQEYKKFKYIQNNEKIPAEPSIIPRKYRHREPIHIFGKPFVYAVFDSLHNQYITLFKASTYLDNLKISDVRQLEQYV